MQRIVDRATKADRLVRRKWDKKKALQLAGNRWERKQAEKSYNAERTSHLKADKIHRREDWELGNLTPRRDVGEKAKTYGVLNIYNLWPPDVDPSRRPKWLHIREGDRAVIIRGPEKGKIGTVRDVNKDKAAVQLAGLNLHDVHIPEWMRSEAQDDREINTAPRHLPLADVKLVYPLPDPKTGVVRDVIIDRLERLDEKTSGFMTRQEREKEAESDGHRRIVGTNIVIPWPEKADEQHEDNKIDAMDGDVQERTFQPFLLRPPMPLTVIDELRNKYGKFRTRHDYEYVQKKELEEAKAEGRKDLIKTMRTPLQELAELRAKQKKLQEKELTEEQLAKIGEVIAQEQAKATSAVRAMEQ